MSSELNEYLESVLTNLGGLGRFQIILTTVVLGSKATIAWSVLMMAFGGVAPDWSCNWITATGKMYMPNVTFNKMCNLENSSTKLTCLSKTYDPMMRTVVSEWDLVCDKDWIWSTITTIQMFGLIIGAFVSGQIGDMYGRKPTYYASIIILLIFNLAAAFSVSWQMFAVLRFFIGIGSGWYLTVDITYLAEFVPMKFRSLILSLPLWPIGYMTFGLISWLLHDWKYIQIACAVFCLPWFLGICIIPESYRWLVSCNRLDEAHEVMTKVAKINGRPSPNKQKLVELVKIANKSEDKKKYTIIDILKNNRLLKVTALLTVCWVTCGYGFYAISFGVQQLSGNLYLNMVLQGLVEVTSFSMAVFANCIGRKKASFLCFLLASLSCLTVGVIKFLELANEGAIINALALASKLFVACGWMALIIFTSELYPTVVRNIGFGFQNTMSKVGSMVAPQLVFASSRIPGIMFLLMGGLFLVSSVCVLLLKETHMIALETTIYENTSQCERNELLSGDNPEKETTEPSTTLI